jgi:hypothetical protein
MQKINKRLILSLAALLVVCGSSLTGKALAHDGGDSGSGRSNDTVIKTAASETENDQETEHSKTLREQFKEDAKTKIQAERKLQAKAKTQEQRQKSCEARKANLTKRMNNSVTAAQRHKDVFDKFYVKVKNFYVTKKLNVANYDELTANVDKAQQDAVDQIAALKGLDVAVDCTQSDSLATNLKAFQTAVGSTRDSLKAYRKSLVALITQIHGASTSTNKNEESSTNATTE